MTSEILKFMGEHPWLTFFLAVLAVELIVRIAVNLPNRILRHWNIRRHGYPPAHCDADGDFKPAEETEE